MSFSFRNLFQRHAAPEASGHPAASATLTAHSGLAGAKLPGHSMQATLPASPSHSQFQFGGSPLFKTMVNEPGVAPPINSSQGMSPFSISGAAATNMPLTVADVIGHLPPEVIRAGALPAEQPLALPPALLENALRSGQAALPVFELYRVCPALFQTPISPQDPRMVPLPAAKLPGLIAQAREGQGNQPSPFSQAQPASPFAAIPPAKPSPFSMTPAAEAAPASPFLAAAPPSAGPLANFPMSPIVAAQILPPAEAPRSMVAEVSSMASPFASLAGAPSPSVASPFAMSQAAPAPEPTARPVASPFSFGAGVSPFGVPTQAAFPPSQPAPGPSFGAAAEQQPTSITGLFTPKSQEPTLTPAPSPFGAPFAAAFKDAAPAATHQNSAQQMPSSSSGMAKLGFAASLSGYSLEELGFNPAMVPAWITTSLPASTLSDQLSSGQVMVELGALLDGLSDVGFRNTLSSAKREAQIRLPQNEVFHALTAATGSSQASGGGVAAAPPQPAPAANSFFVQPGAATGQPSQVEAAPQSMFASQPAAPQPSPAPHFAAAAPADPGLNQPPSQPFAPKFGASLNPFATSQPASAPTAAPSLFTPLLPEPAAPQQAVPSLFAPTPAASPASSLFKAFGAPPAAFALASQPTAQPTGPLVAAPKPFDPFASTGQLAMSKLQTDSGFSSAQLLGQMPPAASQPSADSSFGAPASEFKPKPLFAQKAEEAEEAFVPQQAPQPSNPGLFSTPVPNVPLFSEPKPAPQLKPIEEVKPAPTQPAPAVASSHKMAAVKHSFLGLSPADTQTDQLLLRALLGTEESLTAPRVVELLARQSGLSACVCLHGSHVLSHADFHKPDAGEFQRQAPEIARQLRGLAPLIGIEGAETFTLNAGGRLLTFCFPDNTTVAVLHENEPSNGLRDKITLIARELARMLG
jgi:hypothetical protein